MLLLFISLQQLDILCCVLLDGRVPNQGVGNKPAIANEISCIVYDMIKEGLRHIAKD